MNKLITKLWMLSTLLWIASTNVLAIEANSMANNTIPINHLEPVKFIKIITTEMLKTVKANKTKIDQKPELLLEIVDNKIMPYVANKTIARKVMGFKWKTATVQQKADFTREFTIYLKRFYSRAFLSYDNQTLMYKSKPKMKGKKIATIYTSLEETGKPSVEIDYKLYKSKNGGWKMIDIVVEGISLVINNQRQYGGQIRTEGVDSVIVKLSYNNQKEFK